MKKKKLIKIAAIILAIVVIATIVLVYKPYSLKADNDAVTAAQEIPYEAIEIECSAENYVMDLTLNTDENTLSGKATAKVINNSDADLTEVCFRYFAPAMGKGSEITSAKNAKTGKKYDFSLNDDNTFVTVNLNDEKIPVGDSATIELEFTAVIPEAESLYGYYTCEKGSLYNFLHCFPQLAILDNGEWFDAPYFFNGETLYNEMSDYYVTLKAPEDYVILASGKSKTKNGVTEIKAENIREMAMVACNFATIETKEVNGVKFNLLKPDYDYKNKDLLNDCYDMIMTVAIEAMELFSKKVGPYIYDEIDIAPIPLDSFGGMEMPGFIQLDISSSDEFFKDDPNKFEYEVFSLIYGTCHEVGHQWFYCGVGNDQYHEAWLDESFTSYLEGYYIRKAKDYKDIATKIYKTHLGYTVDYIAINNYDQGQDNKFYINFPSEDYRSYDYGMIYNYGENFFRKLEKAMGQKEFFTMLSDWYNNNVNTVVDGYSFIQHVMKYDSSEKVKEIINQYISEEHLK